MKREAVHRLSLISLSKSPIKIEISRRELFLNAARSAWNNEASDDLFELARLSRVNHRIYFVGGPDNEPPRKGEKRKTKRSLDSLGNATFPPLRDPQRLPEVE
jgi:hypothetical protein